MNSAHYYHTKLVTARELRGETQEQVAEDLGVTTETISRAERGAMASYTLLAKLCHRYGIPMDKIVRPCPELVRA